MSEWVGKEGREEVDRNHALLTDCWLLVHVGHRLAAVGPHTAGNVTGLTLLDFLALPPKAKVSLTFQGEDGGEGFLSLRKM